VKLADAYELILAAIACEDDVFQREPGFVLADLSLLTGISYSRTSQHLLEMERQGLVKIDRLHHDDPQRANRLIRITPTTPTRSMRIAHETRRTA